MTTANYDMAQIGQARQIIGAEAGKFGGVADGVPATVSAGMFGTLPNSGTLARAADALCSLIHAEYAKAESLVGAIERTLDMNVTNKTNTEQGNKQSFTVRQV
jgi:hypothetical protein